MRRRFARVCLAVLVAGLASACQHDPESANGAALKIGAPRTDAPAIRERQTTTFQGTPENILLAEATQVLQDLGFTVEESAPRFGVLAGSKDRDAVEAPQVAAQVALTIGLALLGVQHNPVWDTDQVIRATLSTGLVGPRDTTLRVSFERIVTNSHGLSRMEELNAPEFSSGFFEKIRQGLGRSQ
jgi:hypothetical protein